MARVAAEDAVKARDLPANERTSIMFGMPAELKAKIEEAAEAKGVAAAAIVREIVAGHFDYTLPDITRGGARRKYKTDEEREAAKKEKAEKRRLLVQKLLKLYKTGDLPQEFLDAMDNDDDEDDDEDEDEDSE